MDQVYKELRVLIAGGTLSVPISLYSVVTKGNRSITENQ